jgi:diguanylate cyclase (GGDEF)-like protein
MTGFASRRWQPSDHYDWLSGYLESHGMSTATRALMAFIVASFVMSLVALLVGADGPEGRLPVAMTWTAIAGGVAGVALWLWRWPTRAQSVAFVLVTNTSIALACLAHPNPLAGLVGCIAFATSGAYVAFFHSTGLVLYNFGVAAIVGLVKAIGLWSSGHAALAGVDLWLVLQVNIALPLAIQILVRALGVDLLRADRDPLTGLLNRRAFQTETLGLLSDGPGRDDYLVVALIDLDSFKALNDARGHSAGDDALVDVARALRASTTDTTVIARSGGEEFLLAYMAPSSDPAQLSQRICTAIAELPAQVTASVGTVSASLDSLRDRASQDLMDRLVPAADAAMYHAKRCGGNGFHHHGVYAS